MTWAPFDPKDCKLLEAAYASGTGALFLTKDLTFNAGYDPQGGLGIHDRPKRTRFFRTPSACPTPGKLSADNASMTRGDPRGELSRPDGKEASLRQDK